LAFGIATATVEDDELVEAAFPDGAFFGAVDEADELDMAACIIMSLALFLAAGREEEFDVDDLFFPSATLRSFSSAENFVNHFRNSSHDI
jgi:hypothetical protein